MHRIATCVFAAFAVFAASAQEARPKFEAFEGQNPESHGSPVFQFSSASATPEDPVIITIKGRAATATDREEHRTAVQRYWLAINVPEAWKGVDRYQSKCFHKRPHEYPSCDTYVFEDPKTGKQHEFYIYIGNWRTQEVEE